jgi:toxin ParE1/3/4
VKRRVFWSESALEELDASVAYIAERNPSAARRVLADIRKAGNELANRSIGRPGRVAGTFERVLTSCPYIIAYSLERLQTGEERVVILHVIHTARDWPAGQWPE